MICPILLWWDYAIELLTLEYKTQEGGELYSRQIFAHQAIWLILQPDLDTAVGKYAENNEHREFYVETLCPTKEKTTTYHS